MPAGKSRRRLAWEHGLGATLLLAGSCSARGEASAPVRIAGEAHSSSSDIFPVGFVLNGLPLENPTLAYRVGGDLLVLRDDLLRLGLHVPASARDVSIEGQAFISMAALPNLSANLSDDGATLLIKAGPDAFVASRLSRETSEPALPLSTVVPLGFVGYDLSLSHVGKNWQAGGLFDLGASGDWGVVATTALLHPAGGKLIRLESSVQRDFPLHRLRAVIGDTFTRAGEINNAVRFGGIRIGTDFSLSPGEINYPLPVLSGTALLPSTVELLSSAGRQSHSVAPGRFLLDGLPTVSGAGELVMTIEDATGAVRQVRRSFYSSARLLRPGLADFSLELGALRKGYGARNAAYGEGFAAASIRRGLSTPLTAGARMEVSPSTAMGGLAFNTVVASLGEVALAGALSGSAAGTGRLWRAQFQRLGPRGSLTASYLRSSARFTQVGDVRFGQEPEARHEIGVTAGLALPVGNLTVGVIDTGLKDGSRYRLSTLGYTATLKSLYLNASIRSVRFAGGSDFGFLISLGRQFGRQGSAALTAERGMLTASYQHSAIGREASASASRTVAAPATIPSPLTPSPGARPGIWKLPLPALRTATTCGRLRAGRSCSSTSASSRPRPFTRVSPSSMWPATRLSKCFTKAGRSDGPEADDP